MKKTNKTFLGILLFILTVAMCTVGAYALESGNALISVENAYVFGTVGENVSISLSENAEEVTYRWYYSKDSGENWSPCQYSGFRTYQLQFPYKAYHNGYQFKCLVSRDNESNWSEVVTLSSRVKTLTILKQPSDSYTKVGDIASFSVEAEGTNLTYRWYYSKDDGETWSPCQYGDSYKKADWSFTTSKYQYGYMFKCLVKSDDEEVYSDVVSLVEMIEKKDVIISQQPVDSVTKVGDVATFSVVSEGTNLTYRWYYSKDNGETWSPCQYGDSYKKPDWTFTTAKYQYNYLYKCLIKNGDGDEKFSEEVRLIASKLEILEQPKDAYVRTDDKCVINTLSNTAGASYRWLYSKDGGVTWENCYYNGYKTRELSFDAKAYQYGYVYKCLVSYCEEEIYTDEACLYPQLPAIVQQPYYVSDADDSIMSVVADGYKLSYEWYYSKNNGEEWILSPYTGRKTSSMQISDDECVDCLFFCRITDKFGNVIESDTIRFQKEEIKKSYKYVEIDDGVYSLLGRYEVMESLITMDDMLMLSEITETDETVNIKCLPNAVFKTDDLVLVHFVAASYEKCIPVALNINDGKYLAHYYLSADKAEFIIPIQGMPSIDKIELTFANAGGGIEITGMEIVNLGKKDITSIVSGIFNISDCNEKLVIDERSGIGYAATDIATDGTYLYSINKGTLLIYSTANSKETPDLVGSVSGLGNTRKIAAFSDGNRLAISSRENGVFFVDVSDKSNPTVVSNLDTLGFATGIDVYGDYCFISSRYHGLEIYDVHDIEQPMACSQIYESSSELYDCVVNDGYVYISSWGQKKIYVYDVNDVCNPYRVSVVSLNGNPGGACVDGDYLYVATGYNSSDNSKSVTAPGYGMGNGFEVYDISNPAAPIWMSTSRIDGKYYYSGYDHWKINVSDGYAYLSSSYNGFFVYQVTNPASPKRAMTAYVNIPVTSTGYKKISTSSKYNLTYYSDEHAQAVVSNIAVVDGYIYIGCDYGDDYSDGKTGNRGLYSVAFENAKSSDAEYATLNKTSAVKNLTNVKVEGFSVSQKYIDAKVYDVKRNGEYYYLAVGIEGIAVSDTDFEIVNLFKTKGAAKNIIIKGNLMFVAELGAGIGVYNIDEASICEIGRCQIDIYNSAFESMVLMGDERHILAKAGWTRYVIVNIEDSSHPFVEKNVSTGTMYFHNIATGLAEGKYSCVYDRNYITWYSIENGNVVQTAKLKNSIYGEANGTAIRTDIAVAISGNGYVYYTPQGVTQETIDSLKVIKIPGVNKLEGEPVILDDLMVVSNCVNRQVTIIDISDIDNPVLISQFNVEGNPGVAYMEKGEIVIPLSYGGILKLNY